MGLGNPRITSNYDATNPGNTATVTNFLIEYSPDAAERAADNLFRISGFDFDFASKCGGIGLFNATTTPTTQVRIDNCTLSNAAREDGTMRAVMFQGSVFGLVDTNTFSGNGKHVDVYGNNVDTWNNFTFSFGSENNVYIENNVLSISTTPHSAGQGGKYVARYNTYTYTGSTALSPWFDSHGNQLSGVYASMGTEVHHNLLTSTNNKDVLIHDGRGGKHHVYSNNVVTSGTVTLRVREEYSDSCDATTNAQSQHISGSYYWGNVKNGETATSCTKGTNCEATDCDGSQACYDLTENTDFFNTAIDPLVSYTCPHPLNTKGVTCTSMAGTAGYLTRNTTLGTGAGIKLQ